MGRVGIDEEADDLRVTTGDSGVSDGPILLTRIETGSRQFT